jgi:hypothetical protein
LETLAAAETVSVEGEVIATASGGTDVNSGSMGLEQKTAGGSARPLPRWGSHAQTSLDRLPKITTEGSRALESLLAGPNRRDSPPEAES